MEIIFYALFILGTAFTSWLFMVVIQEGQIFGFWDKVINKVYGWKRFSFVHKWIGGCHLCTANMMGMLSFVVYTAIFGWIVHTESRALTFIGNYFTFAFFVSAVNGISLIIAKSLKTKDS